MRILSIGECMAELAPAQQPGEFRLGFAGDTFNTAWYLAQLCPEHTVSFYSAIGDDEISQKMRKVMTDVGIDDSFVQVSHGRTVGLYMISLDNGERSFSYWRGQSAARLLADDIGWLTQAIDASEMIYVSGITLAILDGDACEKLFDAMAHARNAGKTVVFDPNLRPKLWPSQIAMTGAIMRAAKVSDVVLPSFDDEQMFFGDKNPQATIDRYKATGATTIIVKDSGKPVHYDQDGKTGTVAVQPVKTLIDSTAAGDSFSAAILTGLANGVDIENSIANACRLAGAVVQGKGALVAIDIKAL